MTKKMTNMNFDELAQEAFETAKAHGWHDEELPDETYLMLIITEIAEAVQADRKDKHADVAKFKEYQTYYGTFLPSEEIRTIRFREDFEAYIKNSVEEELADIIIRCLDLAGLREISLNGVTEMTHTFHVRDYSLARLCYALCCHVTAIIPLRCKIADVMAYTLAWCSFNSIDIGFFVEQKMRFNKLRDYKHGNKKY